MTARREPKLHRSEEQAERVSCASMVRHVCLNDPAEEGIAQQGARSGNASVHEPVMNEDIANGEDGHANPETEGDLSRNALFCAAAPKNERDSDRCVEQRERIVRLEPLAGLAGLVMRSVNEPEPAVPNEPVKETSPNIHRDGGDDGDRAPDEKVSQHRP